MNKKNCEKSQVLFGSVVWTKLKVDHRKRRRVLSQEIRSLSSLYDSITSCLLKPLHSALFMFPSSHCASLSWLFSFHLNTFPSNAFFFTLIHFFFAGQTQAEAAGAPHIDCCGEFDAALLSPSPWGSFKWKHITMNHTAGSSMIDRIAYYLLVTVWR